MSVLKKASISWWGKANCYVCLTFISTGASLDPVSSWLTPVLSTLTISMLCGLEYRQHKWTFAWPKFFKGCILAFAIYAMLTFYARDQLVFMSCVFIATLQLLSHPDQ